MVEKKSHRNVLSAQTEEGENEQEATSEILAENFLELLKDNVSLRKPTKFQVARKATLKLLYIDTFTKKVNLKISQLAAEQRQTSTKPNQTPKIPPKCRLDGWVLGSKNGFWSTMK